MLRTRGLGGVVGFKKGFCVIMPTIQARLNVYQITTIGLEKASSFMMMFMQQSVIACLLQQHGLSQQNKDLPTPSPPFTRSLPSHTLLY